MNAARHEGLSHLTALVQASGASRNHINSNHAKTNASTTPAAIASIIAALSDIQRSPRKNHLNPKYVSAISIAAPIHHHMRTAFGFVLPRNHSLKSRLQTSAPTVVATNFVAPHSRANAGHRGCV